MTADPETVRREKAQAERVAAELIQAHKSALNRYDELVDLAAHAYLLGLQEGLNATARANDLADQWSKRVPLGDDAA